MLVLSNASTAELAEAADANFVNHATWAATRTLGMRVLAEPRLVVVDSGLPCDTFNVICRARLTSRTAPPQIQTTLSFYASAHQPFSWWVGPADQPTDLGSYLIAAGLLRAETELAMAADLTALPGAPLVPPGLEIRRVRTEQELAHFAQIIGDPYALRFYELTAPALLTPDAPQWFYLGYWDNQPVATAELTLGGGVVGLYSIITLEAYRRRGIGSALTLQPLLDAREHGFQTGVLQAADAGVGVYTRLGFKPFGNITEYKPAPSTA